MNSSCDSTPITTEAMESISVGTKKVCSIDCDGLSADSSQAIGASDVDGGITAAAPRREAPGVTFSNTPPQSSNDENIKLPWIAAEDWFEWSFYVNWDANWDELIERLKRAKKNAAYESSTTEMCSILFMGGYALVDRMGARLGNKRNGLYFAYKLQYEDLYILIAEEKRPHKTKPNVIIRATGEACLCSGARKLYKQGTQFIQALQGTIVSNKMSRVDICLDMPNCTMGQFNSAYMEERYICRAKSHGRYSSCGVTISFGSYPSMLRIYDKKAEAIKKGNALQLHALTERRWGGKLPDSAIRVEFELGRDFFKKNGVNTVEDYYAKRGALLNYLTKDWIRFTQNKVDRKNKNQSKAVVLPIWDQIRAAFLKWADSDINQELSPLKKDDANVSHLIKVAVGITKAAAKTQGWFIENHDEFMKYLHINIKRYEIDDTLKKPKFIKSDA